LYNLGLNVDDDDDDDEEDRKDNMIQDNIIDSIFDNPIR
jgi:hypothetical protein